MWLCSGRPWQVVETPGCTVNVESWEYSSCIVQLLLRLNIDTSRSRPTCTLCMRQKFMWSCYCLCEHFYSPCRPSMMERDLPVPPSRERHSIGAFLDEESSPTTPHYPSGTIPRSPARDKYKKVRILHSDITILIQRCVYCIHHRYKYYS